MEEFKSLLVVYDPTREDQPALERAADIAEALEASVRLFACVHEDTAKSSDPSGDTRQLIAQQQALLEEAIAPLRKRGIDISTEVEWDRDWYHAAVRAALRHSADLVLKSSYHHTVGKRILKSTSDWAIMRECSCPVLLVKGCVPVEPRRVLAAIDISATQESYERLNARILEISSRILERGKAEVHFVNAFQDFKVLPDKQKLVEDWGLDPDKIHIKLGKPEKVIVERARELDISLLVIGNSGRSGLLAALVGNTVEKVLDKLDCDVLSIP